MDVFELQLRNDVIIFLLEKQIAAAFSNEIVTYARAATGDVPAYAPEAALLPGMRAEVRFEIQRFPSSEVFGRQKHVISDGGFIIPSADSKMYETASVRSGLAVRVRTFLADRLVEAVEFVGVLHGWLDAEHENTFGPPERGAVRPLRGIGFRVILVGMWLDTSVNAPHPYVGLARAATEKLRTRLFNASIIPVQEKQIPPQPMSLDAIGLRLGLPAWKSECLLTRSGSHVTTIVQFGQTVSASDDAPHSSAGWTSLYEQGAPDLHGGRAWAIHIPKSLLIRTFRDAGRLMTAAPGPIRWRWEPELIWRTTGQLEMRMAGRIIDIPLDDGDGDPSKATILTLTDPIGQDHGVSFGANLVVTFHHAVRQTPEEHGVLLIDLQLEIDTSEWDIFVVSLGSLVSASIVTAGIAAAIGWAAGGAVTAAVSAAVTAAVTAGLGGIGVAILAALAPGLAKVPNPAGVNLGGGATAMPIKLDENHFQIEIDPLRLLAVPLPEGFTAMLQSATPGADGVTLTGGLSVLGIEIVPVTFALSDTRVVFEVRDEMEWTWLQPCHEPSNLVARAIVAARPKYGAGALRSVTVQPKHDPDNRYAPFVSVRHKGPTGPLVKWEGPNGIKLTVPVHDVVVVVEIPEANAQSLLYPCVLTLDYEGRMSIEEVLITVAPPPPIDEERMDELQTKLASLRKACSQLGRYDHKQGRIRFPSSDGSDWGPNAIVVLERLEIAIGGLAPSQRVGVLDAAGEMIDVQQANELGCVLLRVLNDPARNAFLDVALFGASDVSWRARRAYYGRALSGDLEEDRAAERSLGEWPSTLVHEGSLWKLLPEVRKGECHCCSLEGRLAQKTGAITDGTALDSQEHARTKIRTEVDARHDRPGQLAHQQPLEAVCAAELTRRKATLELEQSLRELEDEVRAVVAKAKAVSPKLKATLQTFGDRALVAQLLRGTKLAGMLGEVADETDE